MMTLLRRIGIAFRPSNFSWRSFYVMCAGLLGLMLSLLALLAFAEDPQTPNKVFLFGAGFFALVAVAGYHSMHLDAKTEKQPAVRFIRSRHLLLFLGTVIVIALLQLVGSFHVIPGIVMGALYLGTMFASFVFARKFMRRG